VPAFTVYLTILLALHDVLATTVQNASFPPIAWFARLQTYSEKSKNGTIATVLPWAR
jgi:hypothetical protein